MAPSDTAAVKTLSSPTSTSDSFLVTATENATLAASDVRETARAIALTLRPPPGTPQPGAPPL
jgi:hypothetical protein